MIQLLKMLSLLVLVVLFQACASSSSENEQQTQENQEQQEAKPKAALGAEECESQQIDSTEAQPMIDSARAYIQSVNSSGDLGVTKILEGARIPDCLWQDVEAELGAKPRVWAMLALQDGELKIIFKGKSATGSTYKYFNFTNPCPSDCPD